MTDRHAHCDATLFRVVSAFMAKDDVRYFLNGVLIEPHEKEGVYVVATDGHRMGVGYDPLGSADGRWICEVSADLVRCLKKKTAERVLFHGDNAVVIGDGDELKAAASSVGPLMLSKPIDGKYPDWKAAVPRGEQVPAKSITFNSAYIAALQTVGPLGRYGGVTFTASEDGANLFRFEGVPNFFGVIMPMRGDGPATVPDWCGKPKKAPAAKKRVA